MTPSAPQALPRDLSTARSRLADFRELSKPRITFMVSLTALAGFILGAGGEIQKPLLVATVLGTALACAGAGAFNMVVEHDTDALMHRTRGRPIPAGRVRRWEGMLYGFVLTAAALVVLVTLVNPLTAAIAAFCTVTYVFGYTPLKRRLRLAILVGAVPGALPPVMGFTGATGALDERALALFAILFFWQVPHFLAIDWLYREDYLRAGFPTTAARDPSGRSTAIQAILYGLILLPASLLPVAFGIEGSIYAAGAAILGLGYLSFGLSLARSRSEESARRLLLASVGYLPLLLLLLIIDKQPL